MDSDHYDAVADPETESVGTLLRRLRESSKISLNEAADGTRISKNYLQALEADRPEELPSPAYLNGFVKIYATWLGMQGDELNQLLARTALPPTVDAVTASKKSFSFSSFSWQRLFLPAVLLGALIISSFFFSPPSPQRTILPVQQPVPVAAPPAPVAAVQPVMSSSVPSEQPAAKSPPVPEQRPETPATLPKPQSGLLVSMKVIRTSTLSVAIDDGVAQGYELNSGDMIEWKAARTIAMDISDAGSVEIELNNAPLKLQAAPGKPVYVVLDANGIRH